MKVIKNNYKKESWKIQCPYCTSILEYDKKDVTRIDYHFYWIKCPCCKKIIAFDNPNIE